MKGKNFKNVLFGLACFSLVPNFLMALPKSPEVVSGRAEITISDQNAMQITVDDHSVIQYQGFSIGEAESVRFIQPSSSSVVLNRVTGSEGSEILGKLESNGKVFLVNPNGVYFGPGAQVDVGSLIASTLDISDADFASDRYEFTLGEGSKNSSIVNLGSLSADETGCIALVSPTIRNAGSIRATTGKVVLASGEKVTLDFSGNGLMQFTVEGSLEKAVIEQSGSIEALQGQVHLSMGHVKQVIQNVINTDGITEGNMLIEENGVILLVDSSSIKASGVEIAATQGSSLQISGEVIAANEQGTGGFVHVFGDKIQVVSALIDASGKMGGGEILVGGDAYGSGAYHLAERSEISKGSLLIASALESGDGGKVVVWSNGQTFFDGKIVAQGGAISGNGGFVETSGKLGLGSSFGQVDTIALAGNTGTWLMDPYAIVINNSGTDSLAMAQDAGDVSSILTLNASIFESATSNIVLSAMAEGGSITLTSGTTISMPSGYGIQFDVDDQTGKLVFKDNTTVQTIGGNITLNGAVILDGDSAAFLANLGDSSANITFASTINSSGSGEANLLVQAGSTGNVSFAAPLGSDFAVGEVIVDAGSMNLSSSIYTQGKPVSITAATLLSGNAAIDTTLGGTYPGANVSFNGSNSTIDGPHSLYVESGVGKSQFGGTVGELRPLYSFKVKGAGSSIASNVTADGNTIIMESPVTVTADVTFTDNGVSGVFFLSTLDSDATSPPWAVTVNAPIGKAQFVGAVGGTNPLSALTVAANEIGQSSNVFLDNAEGAIAALTYSAPGGITVGCDIDTGIVAAGSIVMNNPATFEPNTGGTGTFTNPGKITLSVLSDIVTPVAAVVTLNGVSAGSGNLVINGGAADPNMTVVTLQNAAVNLVSLSVIADSIIQDSNSAIFATGDVTLDASAGTDNQSLTTASSISTTSGTILLKGGVTVATIDSNLSAGTGNITLTPATDGVPISYQGVMQTAGGTITANAGGATEDLLLTGSTNIDVGDGSIVLNKIDGAHALTISGSSVATLSLGAAIGGTAPLSSLIASIGRVTQSSTATATGAVSYIAPLGIALNGTSIIAPTGFTAIGPVNLGANLSITTSSSNGNIAFNTAASTIVGAHTLTLVAGTGVVYLSGAIGTGTPLTSLTVSSATQVVVASNITTTGAIAFTPAVVLTGESTMFSTTPAAITFSSTLNGTQSLNVSGSTVTFGGVVGGTNYLAGLNVTGTSVVFNNNAANVNVVGGQTVFNGPVVVGRGGGVTFTNDGLGVAFLSTVNSDGTSGTLTVNSPTGTAYFGGTLGDGVNQIGQIDVTALDIQQLGAITTITGNNVTFTGTHSILLGADITTIGSGSITMNNPVTIGTSITLSAATGDVTLSGVVAGSDGLAISTTTGTVSLAGAPYNLSSLAVTTSGAGAINQAAVSPITTIGNLTLSSGSTVTTLSSLITGGGNIALTGTTSLAITSNMSTAGGNISLSGATTYHGGTIYTGNGSLSVANAFTLATAGTSINVGSGSATFSSTVGGAQSLSVNGTAIGSLTFTGAIGGTPLTTLVAEIGNITQSSTAATVGAVSYDGVSGISLGGNITTSNGAVTIIGPTTLTAGVTLDTSTGNKNIAFEGASSTVDGGFAFALNAGTGNVRLDGSVGINTTVASLTLTGSGTALIGAPINTTNEQGYGMKIVLTGDCSMSTSGAAITFSNTINGSQNLFVNAGTSTVAYNAAVGNITPLLSLDTIATGGISVSAPIKTR